MEKKVGWLAAFSILFCCFFAVEISKEVTEQEWGSALSVLGEKRFRHLKSWFDISVKCHAWINPPLG